MKGKTNTLRFTSIEKRRSPSGVSSEKPSDRPAPEIPDDEEWERLKREREILALKAELNALKREVALIGLNLLDISGAMEHALREDRPQSILELRRLVSRIKGMV